MYKAVIPLEYTSAGRLFQTEKHLKMITVFLLLNMQYGKNILGE
jgi:hypothetical protein